MKLRPYQEEAISAARRSLSTNRAAILKLATGCGKTIIAAGIIKAAADKGSRVLFMAHTNELIQQAADKLCSFSGVMCEIEKAESIGSGSLSPLVVASVQSISNPKRLQRFSPKEFNLIITDETHRGTADSYRRVYDYFPAAKLIGLTATPFRSDDKSLGDVYDEVCFDYGLEKAIDDGYLCPIVSETIPLDIDLSKVKVVAGDFKDSDVADAIEPIMGAVAAELQKRAGNRKICVFLPLVASSKKFAQTLRDYGFDAEHIDGKSEDRKEILERFSKKGGGSALCNSALLTEGWDEPSVDCIVVLSPTRSTVRYIQMIGRGTRLFPGKENLYVPDFLWHGANHNLCHPACLVAKTKEVAEKMRQIQDKKGGAANIKDIEEEAHSELVSDRERALAENLKAFIGNKSKKFDPVLQSISLIDDSLVDWKPETKRDAAPATEAQIAKLERHGFDAHGMAHGYAEKIIQNLNQRFSDGLCTPKQVRLLLKHGFSDAYKMTFDQASKEISKIVSRSGYGKRRR